MLVNLDNFCFNAVSIEVSCCLCTAAEVTRSVLFRRISHVVASRDVCTTEDFFCITNTVAICINTISTANTAGIEHLTGSVCWIVEVACRQISAGIQFITNAVTIHVIDAVSCAIEVVLGWVFTAGLVIVNRPFIKVASHVIHAAYARGKLT